MENENLYLTWIKANSKLLSVSALEQFIGVPTFTLQHYIQGTREVPAVHLPKLEKLAALIRPDETGIVHYVVEQVIGYANLKTEMDNKKSKGRSVSLLEVRQEQLLESLVDLHLVIAKSNPGLAEQVYRHIRGLDPLDRYKQLSRIGPPAAEIPSPNGK